MRGQLCLAGLVTYSPPGPPKPMAKGEKDKVRGMNYEERRTSANEKLTNDELRSSRRKYEVQMKNDC